MPLFDKTLYEIDTAFAHYQVVETIYKDRPSRVLFSGDRAAAQSGIALDDRPELLFDYNQRLLELTGNLQPQSAALVGGGAYTLPRALHETLPDLPVDVVERDAELLRLAKTYFGLRPWPGLHAYDVDGRAFMDTAGPSYDLIMVDAFSNLIIPRELATLEAIQAMARRLTPDGILAMNIIAAYRGRSAIVLERLAAAYQAVFPTVGLFPAATEFDHWQAQNYLLLGTAGDHRLSDYMRYRALPLPSIKDVWPLRDN